MKKKYIRWTLGAALSPFLLFLFLCILIYLPPVQHFLVRQATVYASEATGMHIHVGRVSLSFPLDLVLNDVEAASGGRDTLLSVRRLQVNVQLLPLLEKQVEVDGVWLKGATVNTRDLIHGLELKGTLGELFLESHGVDLDPETAILNKVKLKDTDLSLCLSDTTAADTTARDTTYWKILLQEIDLQQVSLALQLPHDSLTLSTRLGRASLRDGRIDLHRSAYSVASFQVEDGQVSYDSGRPLTALSADSLPKGFDPSHLALSGIGIRLDSLHYEGRDMKARIRQLVLKERSGLEVVATQGSLRSDAQRLQVPSLRVETADSYLELQAALDWAALDGKPQGGVSARLMADIGKGDVFRFLGSDDPKAMAAYPAEPLRIRTGVDGDLKRLKLNTLVAELPGALELYAQGELTHLTDTSKRGGDLTLEAEALNLKFLPALSGGFTIPSGTRLEGQCTVAGSRVGADLLLRQPQAQAVVPTDTVPLTVHADTISLADDFRMERAARIYAQYDGANDRYQADLAINRLDLHQFLPADSLYGLTTRMKINGQGFDIFSPHTRVHAEGTLDRFQYGRRVLTGVSLQAKLEQSRLQATLGVKNWMVDLTTRVEGMLKKHDQQVDVKMDIARMDWQAMRITNQRLQTSQQLGVRFHSDGKQSMALEAEMTNATLVTAKRTTHPKDLFAGFRTSSDSTQAYLRAGDLSLNLDGEGPLEHLTRRADLLAQQLMKQWESKRIVQEELREFFPGFCLRVVSGPDNPVANYLSLAGVTYQRLFMDLDSSPLEGLNGEAFLYGLRTDSLLLDTIFLDIQQEPTSLSLLGGVVNGPKRGQEAFDVTLEGQVGDSQAQLLVQYLNARKEQGVYMGLMAELQEKGIRMRMFPEHPTFVYRPFTVNPDNYIFWTDQGRIYADLHVHDEQGSGLRLYTNLTDTLYRQDISAELSRINLQEFRRIMPYLPDMEGWLGAEVHYVDMGKSMMLSSDWRLDEFKYEGTSLGNWECGGVYLPGEEKDHHLDAYVRHNGHEVAHLGGIYLPPTTEEGTGSLSGEMAFQHFPLDVLNPFVPGRTLELGGDIDGALSVKGDPSQPLMNGQLALDSVSIFLPELSTTLRFDNRPVPVTDSRLQFRNYEIFTKGKNPFTVNGEVDLADLSRMRMNLDMQAENFELVNAPHTKRAVVYGKLYVDFQANLRGPVDELVMRGNMNVLGKTDVTYVLKDSPLTVNDRLGDMVQFVNFNDTVAVEDVAVQPLSLGGMDVAMTLHIDQAVQARVDLVADGSNYMLLEGGGDLSFQYTPRGDMLLTGRYSLISGDLKYEIPIIPLKTFSIRNGSYVEWTGNVMNPRLNILATERVRASVGEEGKAPRNVSFDVGIALDQTLENLGLAFTLSAPEDASVQDQLNAMSKEERGKLAVTMLVTGMYMAEGNASGGFNVNNALNSFLQNEISNIAGKAVDINVGMETVDNAESGGKRTDYNFQFAKRFWNNRFRIVIGGKVSTGNTAQQDETFIDNVSVEYRLDNSGTRYVKVFHDKNYESVLEGEVIETGVGIVLRKKMTHLGELFIFKSKKKKKGTEE